jgi:hypothetical protein
MLIDAYTRKSWEAMKDRCDNPFNLGYKYYGALDVSYDPRWKSIVSFCEDMGVRPQNRTLERLDSSLPYCKDNCVWATVTAQNRNRPTLVKLTLEKAEEIRKRHTCEGLTQSRLATLYGVSRRTVRFVLSNERWIQGAEL